MIELGLRLDPPSISDFKAAISGNLGFIATRGGAILPATGMLDGHGEILNVWQAIQFPLAGSMAKHHPWLTSSAGTF